MDSSPLLDDACSRSAGKRKLRVDLGDTRPSAALDAASIAVPSVGSPPVRAPVTPLEISQPGSLSPTTLIKEGAPTVFQQGLPSLNSPFVLPSSRVPTTVLEQSSSPSEYVCYQKPLGHLDTPPRTDEDLYHYEVNTVSYFLDTELSLGSVNLFDPSVRARYLQLPRPLDKGAALTPPAEGGAPSWPSQDNHSTMNPSPVTPENLVVPGNIESDVANAELQPPSPGWLEPAITTIISSLQTSNPQPTIQMLSQAFPIPTIDAHTFPVLLSRIQNDIRPHPQVINLTYAVPRKFKLSHLPDSNTSTPRDTTAKDYFSQIIPSAVPSRDIGGTQQEEQPSPMIAPSSVHLTIVERLIPPSSVAEVLDTFDPNVNFLLTDRLKELSPHNGCLLFIYPTASGARTFADAYVSPCLDPLLRSMAVRYDLTEDFGLALGSMAALDAMPEFPFMSSKLSRICTALSTIPMTYHIVHSSRQEITLGKSWTKWYVKQEKPRIKRSMDRYFTEPTHLTKVKKRDEVHQSGLMRELLDGLLERGSRLETEAKVEVGVFVVEKMSTL